MTLSELIIKSENAAICEVLKLDEQRVTFRIEERLYGSSKDTIITMPRFIDWDCGKRAIPYKVGMKELVFYESIDSINLNHNYKTYGGGGESELVIRDNELLYFNGFNTYVAYDKQNLIKLIVNLKRIHNSLEDYKSAEFGQLVMDFIVKVNSTDDTQRISALEEHKLELPAYVCFPKSINSWCDIYPRGIGDYQVIRGRAMIFKLNGDVEKIEFDFTRTKDGYDSFFSNLKYGDIVIYSQMVVRGVEGDEIVVQNTFELKCMFE